jgi:hypothetical protein
MIECNEVRCNLKDSCQRFKEGGIWLPSMPFFPGGEMPENWDEYMGALNGCPDYWPFGTGHEWFENNQKKTPNKI